VIGLAVLAAAAILLGSWETSGRRADRAGPLTLAAQTLVQAPADSMLGGLRSIRLSLDGWRDGRSLAERVQRLEQENMSLRLYGQELETLRSDLAAREGLEKALGTVARSSVPAVITGFRPIESTLTLNVGEQDGVKPGDPVVTRDGLAGVIDWVGPRTSQVILITSPELQVGAKVVRDAASFGLTRGLRLDTLLLEITGTAPVDVGDSVLTSGLSDRIPGGLPIGEVTRVVEQANMGTRLVTIFPAFRIGRSRVVAVIR
jgi:rod shape-determining protein MreC